jgi:hypothetical protein
MWNVGGAGINYGLAMAGRLWSAATNPMAVNPDWIGNTVYNEMTPILLFRMAASSAVTATRAALMSITLHVTNLPGDNVHFRVVSDRIDRYVTLSGIAHSNGNSNAVYTLPANVGRPNAQSNLIVYDEHVDLEAATFTNTMNRSDIVGTTTVAGSPSDIDYGILPAGRGNSGNFTFNGGVIIEPNTIVAVYAWSATVAPQGRFAAMWTEERLQLV